MNRSRALALAVAFALAPASAQAAGYGIYEQGSVALGMGGAQVAAVRDASAQFFNPAAISRLEGRQLSFGGSWIQARTSFAGVDPSPGFAVTEEMKNGNFVPPTLYWTSPLGEKLAYGLGVNAPFGLGVEWQDADNFTGRERVTKATLRTLDGSASLAWALDERWSVAFGADAMFAQVELNNIGTFVTSGGQPVNVTRAKLESDWKPGFGFHAAALLKASDAVKLGATFRSKVTVKVDDGRATFTQIPSGDLALDLLVAANKPANQAVRTELVFPAVASVGLAWDPNAAWTLALDGVWTQWSAFEKLPLRFPSTPSLDRDILEEYEDGIAVRMGAEHRLESYTYRFGYYFDPAAAPVESLTPLLPDASRHGVTVGLGWTRGAWTLDAYNLFLFLDKRSTEGRERDGYDGTYKSYVNSLGASLSHRW